LKIFACLTFNSGSPWSFANDDKMAAENDVNGHIRWTAVCMLDRHFSSVLEIGPFLWILRSKSRVLNSVYITRIIALPFLPVRPIICPDIDACGADPVPQTSVLSAVRLLTIGSGAQLTIAVIRQVPLRRKRHTAARRTAEGEARHATASNPSPLLHVACIMLSWRCEDSTSL
jgi:hypothetical protein